MPSFADQAASRRKFLQFLAGSPLLAAGGLEAFAGEGPIPGTKLPDPLMWAPMRTTELIKTPNANDNGRRCEAVTSLLNDGMDSPCLFAPQ